MRVFLFSLAGIPLLIADGVLLYLLPGRMADHITAMHGWLLLAGIAAYPLIHFLFRKPERIYLWGHELTHLIVAKLFLRRIHGFHITSRSGGKVVIDRTNIAIDLAPYAVPLYNVVTLLLVTFTKDAHPHAVKAYLVAAGFLLTMHLVFSAEGFLDGQPDVRRSGRLFSLGVVLLILMLWLPLLAAPCTRAGFTGIPSFYREWMEAGMGLISRSASRVRIHP